MSTPKRTTEPAAHAHRFVEQYDGLVGFGLDRKTDEHTLIYYLQKVSDDALAKTLVERMSDEELEQLFSLLNRLMKRHLKDGEYHRLFLKEDHP
ncbi:MAG: cytoplasmic protein [Desulfobacterales bacterium]|nr:cytoplasmic protein [Desulfobacterales bacterium]